MTNRQSNIIFYAIICLVLSTGIINLYYPEFFERFSKSSAQLSVEEALAKGELNKALAGYNALIRQSDEQDSVETAQLYEAAAQVAAKLGNDHQRKDYYLKALAIRKPLEKKDRYSLAAVYTQLGLIAETENRLEQAQAYYEQALATRLGDVVLKDQGDPGMFIGLQNERVKYTRLNHPETIATYQQLAQIHLAQQHLTKAREYYAQAMAASQITFGEDSVEVSLLQGLIDELPR